MTAAEDIRRAAHILEVVSVDAADMTESQQDAARHLSGICAVLADSVEAMQEAELVTDGGVERLHYASARPGKHRALHVDEDCPDLKQANNTNSAPVSNLPRGSLCGRCGADEDLDELQSHDEFGGQDLPGACPSCGYAMVSAETDRWWHRTPQGRPKCPDCGAIPPGHDLDRHPSEVTPP